MDETRTFPRYGTADIRIDGVPGDGHGDIWVLERESPDGEIEATGTGDTFADALRHLADDIDA